MRLIDADALKEGIKELKRSPWYNNDINPSWKLGIKDAVHVVETLCIDAEPTVDAEPVIRCKDCVYAFPADAPRTCTRSMMRIKAYGFCAWAERRKHG